MKPKPTGCRPSRAEASLVGAHLGRKLIVRFSTRTGGKGGRPKIGLFPDQCANCGTYRNIRRSLPTSSAVAPAQQAPRLGGETRMRLTISVIKADVGSIG